MPVVDASVAVGGVITLKFVNTCKETPDLGGSKSTRDRDFKWYYELLTKSAKKKITDGLSTKDLPTPRYCTESADKGALAQALSERKALVLSPTASRLRWLPMAIAPPGRSEAGRLAIEGSLSNGDQPKR